MLKGSICCKIIYCVGLVLHLLAEEHRPSLTQVLHRDKLMDACDSEYAILFKTIN